MGLTQPSPAPFSSRTLLWQPRLGWVLPPTPARPAAYVTLINEADEKLELAGVLCVGSAAVPLSPLPPYQGSPPVHHCTTQPALFQTRWPQHLQRGVVCPELLPGAESPHPLVADESAWMGRRI